MKVHWEPIEEEIIRQVVQIQLESLEGLLYDPESEEEMDDVCEEYSIERVMMEEKVLCNILVFKDLKENPEDLFELDPEDLSTVKHILTDFMDNKICESVMKNIWRKVFLIEQLQFTYNPN